MSRQPRRERFRPTWRTGSRYKTARALAAVMTPIPTRIASAAFARVHRELVEAIVEEPAEMLYGGTTGAIAAVAEAGRKGALPFAVDFEDFHCGEHESPEGDLSNALGRVVMQLACNGAAFVTAGSTAIANACRDELGVDAIPINNVFPLPAAQPVEQGRQSSDEFAVYWFSQT